MHMKGHKLARVSYACQTRCECGWESSLWYNKDARSNAYMEWHAHKDKVHRERKADDA